MYREANGFLNFDYQFEITSAVRAGHPIWLTADSFSGVTTNVGFTRAFSLILGVPAPSGKDKAPFKIVSVPTGEFVSFEFQPGNKPGTPYYSGVLVVETNATSFQPEEGVLKDGRGAAIDGAFAPGP